MRDEATRSMTPERFGLLAEAYGAGIRRWPEADREAARRLQASGAREATEALSRAAALDDHLDRYGVPAPSHALYRNIVASAPPAPAKTRVRWWLSVGLASAGCAGALAGASAITLTAPAVSDGAGWGAYEATAFGELGDDGS